MEAKQLNGGIINRVRVIDDSIINSVQTPNALTNALVLKFQDQEVVVDRTDAVTITIPLDAPIGKTYRIIDIGAARLTVAGQSVTVDLVTTSVTLNSVSELFVSTAQYGVIDIVVIGVNDCVVTGVVQQGS